MIYYIIMKERVVTIDNIHEHELVADGYFERLKLTGEQTVGHYLSNLSEEQQHHANMLAHDLYNPDKPLASTVAIIPVAAHQEAANIVPAMAEFAKQTNSEPFSVVLYPNAPFSADEEETTKTHKATLEAQALFPHLDLRSTVLDRFDEITIGELRGNIWNAVTLLAHHEGAFASSGNVIALNTDIDLARLNHNFVGNIQRHVQPMLKSGEASTGSYWARVKHAYDPKLPNASRVAFLRDFALYQMNPQKGYEAGMVTTLTHYTNSGGFKPQTTHETFILSNPAHGIIPRTILETSPRRYAQRLAVRPDLQAIWDKDFTDTDECRTSALVDITERRAETSIDNSLDFIMAHFYDNALKQMLVEANKRDIVFEDDAANALIDEYVPLMERQKKLAINVINRVFGFHEITNGLQANSDTRTILQNYLYSKTLAREAEKIFIEIKPAKQ